MAYKFQLGKAKLSGSIETAQEITSQGGLTVNGDVDLDAGVINTAELADVSVTAAKLAAAAVETAKIQDLAVTNGKLAGGIMSSKFDGTSFTGSARSVVSVSDAGGDGSLAYDSGTGVITYTGPSAAEARAHFSAVDAGGDGSFSYAAGVFTYTGPSAAEARAHFSALTGAAFQNGNIQYNSATGQITLQPVEESWVRGRLSSIEAVKYNVGSGQVSLQLSGSSLAQNADGLKADLKPRIGAYDNSGSLAYNIANGELTFNPVAPTWVKGHFSAGAGLDYDSATGAFSVGSAEVTNAMLAGAIENVKLVNSSVSVVAGGALTGGGTVALGSSITLDVAVNGDALEVTGDAVALKGTISGARTFANDVTISGNLTVNGTTTYINTTNLDVADALVKIASGSAAFAANQGLQLGGYAELKTAAAVADVGNALSSSLPLVAPSMKAGTFYGNFVGASILGIVTEGAATANISANVTRANAASQLLTLPSAPAVGQEHRIKCVVADASIPVIRIKPYAGGKIEGVVDAEITLESFGAAISLVYGGSSEGWMVF